MAGNTIQVASHCREAMGSVNYKKLRERRKPAAFARGETRELMGIGVAFFTEIVGAGPRAVRHPRHRVHSAEIRIHPTGTGICRLERITGSGSRDDLRPDHHGQLGLAADNIAVEDGNLTGALRTRHLRFTLDAGFGRRNRDGLP
jgi:carbon-monoxide dehydrogenase large subunit